MNCELPDVQAGFRKGRGPKAEIILPTSLDHQKQESLRKTSTSGLLTMPNPLTVLITTNCGKIFKRWDTRSPDLPPEKYVCRSRSNS